MELDPATIGRTQRTFERALAGGKSLTRTELAAALGRAGIVASGQRLAAIVMHAELDQVLCSGPRRGKQFTYMLIAERAPQAVVMERDAAIVELARRFFRSHGPATLRDFVWWSGLTVGEARGGLEAIRASLDDEKVGDATYYMVPSRAKAPSATGLVHLLPNYDEYLIAYRDRAVAGMRGDGRRAAQRRHLRARAHRRRPLRRHLAARDQAVRRPDQRHAVRAASVAST